MEGVLSSEFEFLSLRAGNFAHTPSMKQIGIEMSLEYTSTSCTAGKLQGMDILCIEVSI